MRKNPLLAGGRFMAIAGAQVWPWRVKQARQARRRAAPPASCSSRREPRLNVLTRAEFDVAATRISRKMDAKP